jgi:hypothetical protein
MDDNALSVDELACKSGQIVGQIYRDFPWQMDDDQSAGVGVVGSE